MADKTNFNIGHFRNFWTSVTLTLTLDRVTRHTVVYHSSTSTYTPNFVLIRKNSLWADADRQTLGQLGGVRCAAIHANRQINVNKFVINSLHVYNFHLTNEH